MIDKLFLLCVKLLQWLAGKFGTTYEAVNILIFCIVWPLITLALVVIIIVQHSK